MSSNELSIKGNPQIMRPAASIAPKSGSDSPEAFKSMPSVSVQEVGRAAASRKVESMEQITETLKHLDDAIKALNEAVKKVPTSLHFSVDDASQRFVVQVTDTDTGEVIRKLPGDAVLRIARQIESLKGVLFDDRF